MSSSGEVLGDVYAEELEAADPLHWSPVDGDGGGVLTGPPPGIHHQLLGLTPWIIVIPCFLTCTMVL